MDLIDREAALELAHVCVEYWPDGTVHQVRGSVVDTEDIEKLPRIERMRHGRWVKTMVLGDCWYECSECKEPYMMNYGTPESNVFFYCPCCGAYMGGNKYETD